MNTPLTQDEITAALIFARANHASQAPSVAALARVAQRGVDLQRAAEEHHYQRADDRCVEDDDKLYAAAGLPPADHRVGDKFEMLKNCARFIDRRCEGGGWPSYVQLETERNMLQARVKQLVEAGKILATRAEEATKKLQAVLSEVDKRLAG